MVPGTPLSGWLIRSAPIYSIGVIHSISTPNNLSNLSCKMNARLFSTNIKMPNFLQILIIIIMLHSFMVAISWGLLLKQVSTSLIIDLAFGIFESNNGEVSWSMWVLLLWTSYVFPSFMCIQNCKMSIFIELSFVVYLFLCCNISSFSNDYFPLICRSLMMKGGWTCPLII